MNNEAKKKILRRIPYGLYVIGVKDGDTAHAFTGSWFSQCSMKPPRVMLGIRHGTRSFDAIRTGRVFSVNFFSKEDRAILDRFFKPAPADGSRFGDLSYTTRVTGAPILDRAVAHLECGVIQLVEAGDHSIVIGEVLEAEVSRDVEPLVMRDTPWHYGG